MTFEEAIKALTLKFTSGNAIEVERATILRKEWDAILLESEKIIKEYKPIGELKKGDFFKFEDEECVYEYINDGVYKADNGSFIEFIDSSCVEVKIIKT